jgi:hypothetical protein
LGELVPEITQLLDRELVRLRKLMDGLRDALSRGGRTLIDDARMRYSNQYQRAAGGLSFWFPGMSLHRLRNIGATKYRTLHDYLGSILWKRVHSAAHNLELA